MSSGKPAFVEKVSEETGIDPAILEQVYDRGLAAWRTGHRPGTTPHQWARARVYSFVQGGRTTQRADKALAIKAGVVSENPRTPKGRLVPSRYIKGISKRAKREMLEEIDEFATADPSTSEAYETWRGDVDATGRRWKTKRSPYTMSYRKNSDEQLRDLERRVRATGEAADARAYGQALLRAGRLEPDTAELLERMGDDAWLVWLFGPTVDRDGKVVVPGEYEWQPNQDDDDGADYADPVDGNQIDDDNEFICTDPNGPDCHNDACPLHYGNLEPRTWRRITSLTGLAIRRRPDGSPVIVRTYWTVDDGGNLDAGAEDEFPVGSPMDVLGLARREMANAQSWADYTMWVIENRRDPLDDLDLVRREPDVRWKFELAQGRPVVVKKAWRHASRRWVPIPVSDLPAEAKKFVSRRSLNAWRAAAPTAKMDSRVTNDKGSSLTLEITLIGRTIYPTPEAIFGAAVARHPLVLRRLADAAEALVAAELEAAQNLIYDHDSSLFWNNEMGWVDRGSAQRFTDAERQAVNLPLGGSWVTTADLPNLPHDPECSCMGCVHDLEVCEGCGDIPGEGRISSEHRPDCSQTERVVCGLHHVCDSLGFDEGAEGENAAAELGESTLGVCMSCNAILSESRDWNDDTGQWELECFACRLR